MRSAASAWKRGKQKVKRSCLLFPVRFRFQNKIQSASGQQTQRIILNMVFWQRYRMPIASIEVMCTARMYHTHVDASFVLNSPFSFSMKCCCVKMAFARCIFKLNMFEETIALGCLLQCYYKPMWICSKTQNNLWENRDGVLLKTRATGLMPLPDSPIIEFRIAHRQLGVDLPRQPVTHELYSEHTTAARS